MILYDFAQLPTGDANNSNNKELEEIRNDLNKVLGRDGPGTHKHSNNARHLIISISESVIELY